MQTKVIFRVWKRSPYNVLALFPDIKEEPGCCLSYEHIGQHGAADYSLCINKTRPAQPAEYADLLRELEVLGYDDLKIGRRQ